MKSIVQFISNTLQNHICDVEHENYFKLQTLLKPDILKQLIQYLENNQDEAFTNSLEKLLLDKNLKEKILELIEHINASKIISKDMAQKQRCTVFYGTNRELNDKDNPHNGYGNKRSNSLSYGTCEVFIPKSRHRKKGTIKGSLWNKLIHLDASHGDIQLKKIFQTQEETFWSTIQGLLLPLEKEQRDALIFIHGYNTSFEGAAIRTAQLTTDLDHAGLTAFFSWPSKGTLLGYLSDEAAIQYSEKYISQFLTSFIEKSGASRVNIIAHSMGNRGLLEAIHRIQQKHNNIKFGQIILAAPDVDADVFKELSPAYSKLSLQTTLYVSSSDKAVGASKWIHAYPRAGFTPPVAVLPSIDTIEVESDVDLLQLGHGYFAEHQSLLSDIDTLLCDSTTACQRKELSEESVQGQRFWKLKG